MQICPSITAVTSERVRPPDRLCHLQAVVLFGEQRFPRGLPRSGIISRPAFAVHPRMRQFISLAFASQALPKSALRLVDASITACQILRSGVEGDGVLHDRHCGKAVRSSHPSHPSPSTRSGRGLGHVLKCALSPNSFGIALSTVLNSSACAAAAQKEKARHTGCQKAASGRQRNRSCVSIFSDMV